MKVLYIYDGDWPRGATRVKKQTRSLADAGHEVFLLSRNRLREPRREAHEWMTLLRLPTFPGDALNQVMNFPAFFNPVWIGSMLSAAREEAVDAMVVVDLPLVPCAWLVAKILGVPLHMDMGEVYPPFLEGLHATGRMRRGDRILRSPGIARALERFFVPKMESVFVVSDESGERCIDELGVEPDRVVVVRNTPEELNGRAAATTPGFLVPPPGDRTVILFVGIMIHDRGLLEAVRSMSYVLRSDPTALLLLVGDGPERPRLEAEVEALNLSGSVVMTGWRSPEELSGFYRLAHVGLLPFLAVGQIPITLANKLFDYMGAGLPVVASDVPPMRRIVEEVGCGELAVPGDPEALAAAIVRLALDPDRSARGERGRSAVRNEYNWGMDGARFVNRVIQVGNGAGTPTNF